MLKGHYYSSDNSFLSAIFIFSNYVNECAELLAPMMN